MPILFVVSVPFPVAVGVGVLVGGYFIYDNWTDIVGYITGKEPDRMKGYATPSPL